MKYRVQKLISMAGFCSRREAESLIKEGNVTVNGKNALIGDKADPLKDLILVNGSKLSFKPNYKVVLLNKPPGIVSTCKDPQGRKTVRDLMPSFNKRLYPVGRLDIDSRGAILLTNNGELTLKLTHPKFAHSKEYLVWLKGYISNETLQEWREGVYLEGKRTIPAIINLIRFSKGNSLLKIIMKEGRNRQIRRISDYFGHQVLDLKRTAISNIELGKLKEGEWRELNKNEWEKFFIQKDKQ